MDKEEKRNLPEVAADYVREQILQGELAQREELVGNNIAVTLEMSRGPVRGTSKQPMCEGLLDYEASKRYSVITLSPKNTYETLFLRDNLENLALERCGGRLLSDSIFLMKDAMLVVKEAVLEDDMGKIIKYDEILHRQILLPDQMERLTSLQETLSPSNGTVFYTTKQVNGYVSEEQVDLDQEGIVAQVGRRGNNYLKHERLLEVLQRGNLEQSRGVVNTHCIANGERIYRIGMKMENQELFCHV